jgi:hypothetical protein
MVVQPTILITKTDIYSSKHQHTETVLIASLMANKHKDQPIRPAESPSAENLRNELIRIHGFHPRLEQVEAIKALAID